MGRQVRRTLNRALMGLVGLILLSTGGLVLIGGQDWPRRWHLPSAWPWARPGDVILSGAQRTRWRDQGWWWPALIAALAVVALLALWWLLAQWRRHRVAEVLVDTRDGDSARVRGRALEDALADGAENLPGVERAAASLTGRRTKPAARVGLRLEPYADPSRAVGDLAEHTLADLRAALGAETLPAEVRLRAARHGAERVR